MFNGAPLAFGNPPEAGPCERRVSQRFIIQCKADYRIALNQRGRFSAGTGMTLNISREGILFTTDQVPDAFITEQVLSVGRRIMMVINWPRVRASDKRPMQLEAWGNIFRVEQKQIAVKVRRFRLRTG